MERVSFEAYFQKLDHDIGMRRGDGNGGGDHPVDCACYEGDSSYGVKNTYEDWGE